MVAVKNSFKLKQTVELKIITIGQLKQTIFHISVYIPLIFLWAQQSIATMTVIYFWISWLTINTFLNWNELKSGSLETFRFNQRTFINFLFFLLLTNFWLNNTKHLQKMAVHLQNFVFNLETQNLKHRDEIYKALFTKFDQYWWQRKATLKWSNQSDTHLQKPIIPI